MSSGIDPTAHGHGPELAELPALSPDTAPTLGPLLVRPRSNFWDRSKILLLLVALWWLLLWAAMTNNPIEPFSDAARNQIVSLWWIEALFGLEVIRQNHYFVSERSARWNQFWAVRIFGELNRATHRISDWNRFRIARVVKVCVLLVILAIVLAGFYHTSPFVSLFQVPAALYSALPLLVQILFAFFFVVFQFVGLFWFLSKGGIDTYYPGDVKTRFTDVWGQDAVLERVKENIIFLKNPDAIEARGGYVPGGILLWGPPGTGKTLIAEAVAGETRNPFVFVDPGAFNNMFFGVGVLKVKGLFRKLRRLALRYGGVVVFFDEADSLGSRGVLSPGRVFGAESSYAASMPWNASGCHAMAYADPAALAHVMTAGRIETQTEEARRIGPFRMMGMGMAGGGGGMGTLQALLSELSGLNKPRGLINRVVRRALGFRPAPPPKYRILVMMASNMPQSLDEALLRPGRIDRVYKVGYPSKAGRIRTYQGYFAKVKHALGDDQIDRLATMTPYATGATIKDLVNESLINAIRDGRETITWGDVVKAKQLKELGPPEDVEYIQRERHAVAVHEACHAVTAARIHRDWTIDMATIEKGGTYLGMVKPVRVEDTFTRWRSDFESEAMVFLASLAGERMFFEGDSSSGVSGDLENATRIATFMEGYWGMGSTVASHGVTREAGVSGGDPDKDRRSKENEFLKGGLGTRIEGNLSRLLDTTRQLLEQNRLEILAVAHALERFKTITGEDVIAIIEGRPGPFIDGRRYHTDHFREVAEDYHRRMVDVHMGRSTEPVSLPNIPGLSMAEHNGEAELAGALADQEGLPEV